MGRRTANEETFEPDVQEVEVKENAGSQEGAEPAEVETEKVEPIKVETKNESKPSPILNPKVPMVKVRAVEDIDATIGGKPYVIRKDREASVPTDVACVLVNSKLAYRI